MEELGLCSADNQGAEVVRACGGAPLLLFGRRRLRACAAVAAWRCCVDAGNKSGRARRRRPPLIAGGGFRHLSCAGAPANFPAHLPTTAVAPALQESVAESVPTIQALATMRDKNVSALAVVRTDTPQSAPGRQVALSIFCSYS